MGHGSNARCGEEYYGKRYQCVYCRVRDLEIAMWLLVAAIIVVGVFFT
jgi:hypothetical protein